MSGNRNRQEYLNQDELLSQPVPVTGNTGLTPYSILQDVVSPTVTYYGWYVPTKTGTPVNPALAIFRMAKKTVDGLGMLISMKYAGPNFDNIWNNRATTVNYD